MDRRKFLSNISAATAATIAGATTLSAKADALEDAMSANLGKRRQKPPGLCYIDGSPESDPSDSPLIRTSPPEGLSRVPSICNRVVFPAPEAPTIEMISPCFISKLTPFSTLISP